jgi:hypothetical protein
MTSPQSRSTWTKDRAGAGATFIGAFYIGMTVCHEFIRASAWAYTVSALVGLVVAAAASTGMLRVMRRLPQRAGRADAITAAAGRAGTAVW